MIQSRVPRVRYPLAIEFRKLLLQGAAFIKQSSQAQCLLSIYDNPDAYVDVESASVDSVWQWDAGQRCDRVSDSAAKAERDTMHLACLLVWFGFSPTATAVAATDLPTLIAAYEVAGHSYAQHELAKKVAEAGQCILMLELHHDGFNPTDPFGIFALFKLDHLSSWDGASIPGFSLRASSDSMRPTTLPPELSEPKALAIDWCEPDAAIDRRTPHFLASDITKAIDDCNRKAAEQGASDWTRRRASNAASYLTNLRDRSRPANATYDRSGSTRTCEVTFTRSGITSFDELAARVSQPTQTSAGDVGVAMTSGRWMDSTEPGGFSFTFCSKELTALVLGARQTEVDMKNAFFAADRMFIVTFYRGVATARRECPAFMAYSEVDDETARPRLLKEAAVSWGLHLDEASKDRSLYKAKAWLCACSNGSGRPGDPRRDELHRSTLACKLIGELQKVRDASWCHPLIVPMREALWRRAEARAELKVDLEKYAWISTIRSTRLLELQWRSFLSYCRRAVEAHGLALMIRGLGCNGYRTTCHV